jgi:hypothetical protein
VRETFLGTIFHNVKMQFGRHVSSDVQFVDLKFLSDTGKWCCMSGPSLERVLNGGEEGYTIRGFVFVCAPYVNK